MTITGAGTGFNGRGAIRGTTAAADGGPRHSKRRLPCGTGGHQVRVADFMKWLERSGRTPREITQRQKIPAILGMSVSRQCVSFCWQAVDIPVSRRVCAISMSKEVNQ